MEAGEPRQGHSVEKANCKKDCSWGKIVQIFPTKMIGGLNSVGTRQQVRKAVDGSVQGKTWGKTTNDLTAP